MKLRTCVTPAGQFIYGIHKPFFSVQNFRENDLITSLGSFEDGTPHLNNINFPFKKIEELNADWIYEVPNAFPFKGTTYIAKPWADEKAKDPSKICLPKPSDVSFNDYLANILDKKISKEEINKAFNSLPESILFSIATTSTDSLDLVCLAELCCEFEYNDENKPKGLIYKKDSKGRVRAVIKRYDLFEALVNNIHLPDNYKEVMVLRPGVQGGSEIVGEWTKKEENSHIFEYLRRNSYIPWGHYAANMANDSVRYSVNDLTFADMKGLRHLYYQRSFVRIAEQLNVNLDFTRKRFSEKQLEELRLKICDILCKNSQKLNFNSTLWGWNYGFDFAPSKYRLHASHQQIHQQFALLPASVPAYYSNKITEESDYISSYSCGDHINDFINQYQKETGQKFFDDYIKAIRTNKRMDDNINGESSLIVYEDENIIVFVPKAQTSQWELQLITLDSVGNILEANTSIRHSIDKAMLITMKIFTSLGAKMVTTIEYPKRFDAGDNNQHLIYSFLPKLPESPGAFSEAQLRWINGHYPEDFALACRNKKSRF